MLVEHACFRLKVCLVNGPSVMQFILRCVANYCWAFVSLILFHSVLISLQGGKPTETWNSKAPQARRFDGKFKWLRGVLAPNGCRLAGEGFGVIGEMVVEGFRSTTDTDYSTQFARTHRIHVLTNIVHN